MVALQSWEFKTNLAFGYEGGAIGASLAAGQGFSYPPNSHFNEKEISVPTSWDPPIYPFIIAAVFKAFGIYSVASAMILIIFQIITSALNCVLLFVIGRRVFDTWVGLMTGLMFAVYPPSIHYAIQKITTANLIVLLLLLIIILLIGLGEEITLRKSFITGFTFGIAILTEPVIIALFPFAIAWLFFNKKFELKARTISVVVIFLLVCFTVTPWQVRNYLVFGKVFFVQSNFSRELFRGNYSENEEASKNEELRYKDAMDEGQRSKIYWIKALDSILNNPQQIFKYTKYRFVYYWTGVHRYRLSESKTVDIKQAIVSFSYVFILLFGLAGIFMNLFNFNRETLLLLNPILFLPFPYYLTWFSNFRYRFPVETILILFSSYALYRIWKLLKVRWSAISYG